MNNSYLLKVICFLLFLKFTTNAFGIQPDSSEESFKYSATFGYWNDNFWLDKEFNRYAGTELFRTNDDFLTANFWLRYGLENNDTRHLADFYLNLITDRKNNYRTDFIVFRYTYEGNQEKELIYRLGTGIALSGNYGGEAIQNKYHRAFGIKPVSLSYETNKTILAAFYGSVRYRIYSINKFIFRTSTSVSWLSGNGPSFLEYGISAIYNPNLTESLYQIRIHLGNLHYYKKSAELSPFFDNGLLWAVIGTIRFFDFVNTSVWITGNQYGVKDQKHYGIAFTFGGTSLVPLNFDDIKFP
ncbi:MAG: hypothetical protein HRU80_14150 [Ignavibacteriales bacterium]|nr:MAG: hypothetical protein HRU80_14150 [Ignavibacteriales bacterium]